MPLNDGRKPWDAAETANAGHSLWEVMIMDDIVNIISSVGFPIAMSLILMWYLRNESETHRQETAGLKDAIHQLELAITTLISKLED